jgi:hypothetical protein
MKKVLVSTIKSLAATLMIHLYFMAGIYIYSAILQISMKPNYIDEIITLYSEHWLIILLITILLICGITYNCYHDVNDKIIRQMAKANERKIKK